MRKDNAGKLVKLGMRQRLLEKVESPRILETHGGKGGLGKSLYLSYPGVVFEKNPAKTPYLLEQRPHWAVYEGDCVKALEAGIGFHHKPNFIDCDPYGSPWPVLRAIFKNGDKLPALVGVAVNDGLREKAIIGGSWNCKDLAPYARKYGNANVNKLWFEIVRELFEETISVAGYALEEWMIMKSGHHGMMTQYAAIIKKPA